VAKRMKIAEIGVLMEYFPKRSGYKRDEKDKNE